MLSYFPGYSDTGVSEDITLAHMLAMATGLDWSEHLPYTDPRNPLTRMWHSRDPVRVALEQPVVAPPGAHFIYNSGTTNLLGEVVRRASGQSLREFAQQYLFSPLGISAFEWVGFKHDPEMAFASSALYLRPRDMAKIGQLMLQEGAWEGEQVVSAEWVRASVRKAMAIPTDMQRTFHSAGYGYQWWLESYRAGSIRAYSARGHGMQFIVVLPDADMVVVFTGGAWRMSPFAAPVQFHEVIEDVILPSIR
jgi:CubicO group peptidase (beta-lactamase class C family)